MLDIKQVSLTESLKNLPLYSFIMIFWPPLVYCGSFSSRLVNKMIHFCYEEVILGYWFSFEAYAKNLREKATQCYLKPTEVLLYVDGQEPHKFLISWTFQKRFFLMSGLKFTLTNVTLFLQRRVRLTLWSAVVKAFANDLSFRDFVSGVEGRTFLLQNFFPKP